MSDVNNILVPTDFSDHSDYALEMAVAYAGPLGARIHLVFVLEEIPEKLGEILKTDPIKRRSDLEEKFDVYFREQIAKLPEDHGVEIVTAMKAGTPFRQLLKYQKKNRMDLIVVSSQGETAIEEVLFGGTSMKIIRYAECPTLLVKKDKYDSRG